MLRVLAQIAAALVAISGAAAAQDLLSGKEAQRQLFKTNGAVGAVSPTLSAADQDILAQVAQTQRYYGAIALSPDEGLLSEATVAAANYHSVEPARTAALAACNAKRKKGSASCVIGADILPPRYEEGRALQLNMEASTAVAKDYRRLRGDKSFAISEGTGNWGFGESDAAALSACASQGASDCAVLLRN